jgi:hypothetical protein
VESLSNKQVTACFVCDLCEPLLKCASCHLVGQGARPVLTASQIKFLHCLGHRFEHPSWKTNHPEKKGGVPTQLTSVETMSDWTEVGPSHALPPIFPLSIPYSRSRKADRMFPNVRDDVVNHGFVWSWPCVAGAWLSCSCVLCVLTCLYRFVKELVGCD